MDGEIFFRWRNHAICGLTAVLPAGPTDREAVVGERVALLEDFTGQDSHPVKPNRLLR